VVQQKVKGKDRTSVNHERREGRQNECLLNNAGLCVLFGAFEKIIVVLLYGSDLFFFLSTWKLKTDAKLSPPQNLGVILISK
jgi:hypothetical protein